LRLVQHRNAQPGGVVQRGQPDRVDAAGRRTHQPAGHHPGQHAQPDQQATGQHRAQADHQQGDRGQPRRPGHLGAGGWRQVQAEQRDDRAGDHRRHHRVDQPDTQGLHGDADHHDQYSGEQHTAQLRGQTLVVRGDQWRDERE
jgi:hypothetical protein